MRSTPVQPLTVHLDDQSRIVRVSIGETEIEGVTGVVATSTNVAPMTATVTIEMRAPVYVNRLGIETMTTFKDLPPFRKGLTLDFVTDVETELVGAREFMADVMEASETRDEAIADGVLKGLALGRYGTAIDEAFARWSVAVLGSNAI